MQTKRTIIFKFETGHKLSRFLKIKANQFLVAAEFQLLFAITSEVERYRREHPGPIKPCDDDGTIFDDYIRVGMPREEGALYDIYISQPLNEPFAKTCFEYLDGCEEVAYVQFDELNKLHSAPNDPFFSQQWGLSKIEAETAWAKSNGDGIIVAVIDSGVDFYNPDLAPNMWRDSDGHCGYDFSERSPDPMDTIGHGTHVAGIIAAVTNNGYYVAGTAPKARIMAVKIFPKAFDSTCALAIKYAVDNGAKVLNNSWGPTQRRPSNPVVADILFYAFAKGRICVFSAGNSDDDVQFYAPANSSRVIAVGATTRDDKRAYFSNYGEGVTIAAPGEGILSLALNNDPPVLNSGTSMAAPFVSGVAAQLLHLNPLSSTLTSIRKRIVENSDKIQTDRPIGVRLNANKSVFKDPFPLLRVEEQVSHSYKGVKNCEDDVEVQAEHRMQTWIAAMKQRYPQYSVTEYGMIDITVSTKHDRGPAWDRKRSCRTTMQLRFYVHFRT